MMREAVAAIEATICGEVQIKADDQVNRIPSHF
jgi:hypothetical protein